MVASSKESRLIDVGTFHISRSVPVCPSSWLTFFFLLSCPLFWSLLHANIEMRPTERSRPTPKSCNNEGGG